MTEGRLDDENGDVCRRWLGWLLKIVQRHRVGDEFLKELWKVVGRGWERD